MTTRRCLLAVTGSLIAWPGAVIAQAPRDSLIRAGRAAYENFQTAQALDLLTAAIDPALGPSDSAWGYAVQLLAQIHIEENRPALAALWLKWALRLAPNTRADTVTFLSSVVAALRAARDSTRPAPGDQYARTSWIWSARGSGDQTARLRVQPTDPAVPLTVLITGRGLVRPSDVTALPPATYEMQASAPGYESARVVREVIPGVTTVLTFTLRALTLAALDSVLPNDVSAASLSRAVRVLPDLYGVSQPPCGSGAVVGRGLVLTTYQAIRGADRLAIELPGGRRVTDGVRIAAYNKTDDLAVLQVSDTPGDSAALGTGPGENQYLWALGFPTCSTGSVARVRAASVASAATGVFSLSGSLAEGQRGAALIDRSGTLVAVSTGGQTAVSIVRVRALLDEARGTAGRNAALTPLEVATRETHRFGTLVLSARAAGALARLRPLEPWQWPELAREAPLPFTFAGPVGRYQAELLVGGQSRGTTQLTIRPGAATRAALDELLAQATPPGAQLAEPRRGGGFPWPIALIGAGGAGAAALFLLKGGGPGPQQTTTGSLRFRVPVNP